METISTSVCFVLYYYLPIDKTSLHRLWESRDGLFKKLSNIDFKKIIPMIQALQNIVFYQNIIF